MDDTKSQWASKTIWGGAVAIVCGALTLAGYTIDMEQQVLLTSSITQIATGVGALVGGVMSIYGRTKASTKITKKKS